MFTRPRVIPVLLIYDGDLYKTVQFGKRTYLGDVVNAVKIFNRKGIDELSILDIGATRNNREPDYDLLKDIASEAFMPLSYGGGVSSLEQVLKILAIGYEKVIINTSLIKNPNMVREAATNVGSQSIIGSIDAKRVNNEYKCVISDGQELLDFSPLEVVKAAEELGCGEIIINSIDNDGMMQGYDLELIKQISESVSIPVIACGGAGKLKDFEQAIHAAGAHAVAGGSVFVYYGRLKAVLITAPSEKELTDAGIYKD